MCGVGMCWFKEGVDSTTLYQMILATEKRGNDAFGLVVCNQGEIKFEFYEPKTFSECGFPEYQFDVGDIIIWNCRAKPLTELESTNPGCIQPLVNNALVISHNGQVANEKWDDGFIRISQLDSEMFIQQYCKFGRNAVEAVESLVGGSAYVGYDLDTRQIFAIRDFKPLAKAYKKGIGYFVMSDREEFAEIFGPMDVAVWENFYYSDISPFTVNMIDEDSGLIDRYPFIPNFVHSLPKQSEKKALVLASGGVDSSVAACIAKLTLKQDIELVHFDLGQKSARGEQKAVVYLSEFLQCPLRTIDLRWLGELGNSVLTDPNLPVPTIARETLKNTVCWTPARNFIMATCLFGIAEATGAAYIYNGWTLEEEGSWPDNSLDFFRSLNYTANFGTVTRPEIVMVERNLMKPEIIKLGHHYGLDFAQLWSCDNYPSDGLECGNCGACELKRLAIIQAGVLGRSVPQILAKVLIPDV
jgi:7-cyano-7-deazaguanine synthase